MVVADDREEAAAGPKGSDDPLADDRMLPHLRQLPPIEPGRFAQHLVGDADLADVMDQAAAEERVKPVDGKLHAVSQASSRRRDSMRVLLRVGVFGLDGSRQREDHLVRIVKAVVEGLELESRPHPGGQFGSFDRFREEIVGPGFEGFHPVLGAAQSRDHHHRDEATPGLAPDQPANLETIEPRPSSRRNRRRPNRSGCCAATNWSPCGPSSA